MIQRETAWKKYEVGIELKDNYSYVKNDLKYFRDIPDENNATPARAAYMYNFKDNTSNIDSSLSKIFSATMLDLSLKGLISFEVVSEKEINIRRIYDTEDKVKELP